MSDDENRDEVEVKTAAGSIRARGTDIIAILVVVIVAVNAAFTWLHMEHTKVAADVAAASVKEVANTLKQSNLEFNNGLQAVVKAQNMATCIAATKEELKESEYMRPNSFCNRMTK